LFFYTEDHYLKLSASEAVCLYVLTGSLQWCYNGYETLALSLSQLEISDKNSVVTGNLNAGPQGLVASTQTIQLQQPTSSKSTAVTISSFHPNSFAHEIF